ncbi:3747_t:CDS:2, partial [Cetraspora pellucida]
NLLEQDIGSEAATASTARLNTNIVEKIAKTDEGCLQLLKLNYFGIAIINLLEQDIGSEAIMASMARWLICNTFFSSKFFWTTKPLAVNNLHEQDIGSEAAIASTA